MWLQGEEGSKKLIILPGCAQFTMEKYILDNVFKHTYDLHYSRYKSPYNINNSWTQLKMLSVDLWLKVLTFIIFGGKIGRRRSSLSSVLIKILWMRNLRLLFGTASANYGSRSGDLANYHYPGLGPWLVGTHLSNHYKPSVLPLKIGVSSVLFR